MMSGIFLPMNIILTLNQFYFIKNKPFIFIFITFTTAASCHMVVPISTSIDAHI